MKTAKKFVSSFKIYEVSEEGVVLGRYSAFDLADACDQFALDTDYDSWEELLADGGEKIEVKEVQ